MTDARVDRSFNYRRSTGLLTQGLVNWTGSAEDLWDVAETAEKRVNARVARELRPVLQAEILDLIRDLKRDHGIGVLMIPHDIGGLAEMVDRVMVMRLGQVVEKEARDAVLRDPRHAYTRRLFSAVPVPDPRQV